MQHSERFMGDWTHLASGCPRTHPNSHRAVVQCFIGQQPFNSPVTDSEQWADKDLDKRAHARTYTERWRKRGLQVPNGTWVALISFPCSWTSYFTHRCSVKHHISQLLCMCDMRDLCVWCSLQYMHDSVVWYVYGVCMWVGEGWGGDDWIPGYRIKLNKTRQLQHKQWLGTDPLSGLFLAMTSMTLHSSLI